MNDVDKKSTDIFEAIKNDDIEGFEILINEDSAKNYLYQKINVDISQAFFTREQENKKIQEIMIRNLAMQDYEIIEDIDEDNILPQKQEIELNPLSFAIYHKKLIFVHRILQENPFMML